MALNDWKTKKKKKASGKENKKVNAIDLVVGPLPWF